MNENQSLKDPSPKPRLFYGWYIVGATWMMTFLVSAMSVGIFFKPILEDSRFNLNRESLSLVFMLGLLLYAALTLLAGRLIDRYGPRFMLVISALLQTGSGLIYGTATALWQIFIARSIYEIKASQSAQVLVNRWFVRLRGRAQGILATGIPLGALLLTPLSQYLITAWGWRQTMLFWGGIAFVVMLPLVLLIHNNPRDKGYAPDGLPLTPTALPDDSQRPAAIPDIAEVSGHSLAQAARLRSFWLLSGTQLICGIGCGFMMTHIVIFATDFGYSAMVGATLLSVQGGVNLIGVLLTGQLSDKYARHKILALTHTVRSLSFFTVVIFIFTGGGSLWMLYFAMALFGFGWFTTSPLTSGLVADLFGGLRMGTIIGVTMGCHTVGMALGSYLGGVTYQMTGSYKSFFIVQGALELVAASFALGIRRSIASLATK